MAAPAPSLWPLRRCITPHGVPFTFSYQLGGAFKLFLPSLSLCFCLFVCFGASFSFFMVCLRVLFNRKRHCISPSILSFPFPSPFFCFLFFFSLFVIGVCVYAFWGLPSSLLSRPVPLSLSHFHSPPLSYFVTHGERGRGHRCAPKKRMWLKHRGVLIVRYCGRARDTQWAWRTTNHGSLRRKEKERMNKEKKSKEGGFKCIKERKQYNTHGGRGSMKHGVHLLYTEKTKNDARSHKEQQKNNNNKYRRFKQQVV